MQCDVYSCWPGGFQPVLVMHVRHREFGLLERRVNHTWFATNPVAGLRERVKLCIAPYWFRAGAAVNLTRLDYLVVLT